MLPLTLSRHLEDFRIGILSIRKKWELFLKEEGALSSLSEKTIEETKGTFIFSHALPTAALTSDIISLKDGEQLIDGQGDTVSFCGNIADWKINSRCFKSVTTSVAFDKVRHLVDLCKLNKSQLYSDYKLITQGRKSAEIEVSNRYSGSPYIFIEDTAKLRFSTLVASQESPIYIGHNAVVMENALLKDGVAVCDKSQVAPGAIICNGTTLGDGSKVGGEVNNSIFFSYSNKAHHGFLGNSVIGSWCNLGAGTTCSNLKNNYSPISLWDYTARAFSRYDTTLFCGLIMGDHSKTGINTTFNTATSIGFASSILGGKIPPKYIPSFVWDDGQKTMEYKLDKALETAERMMKRRGIIMEHRDRELFKKNFVKTQPDRLAFIKTFA